MKTSQAGIDLICHYEGVKLHAYPDPATGGDPWTIGVGHTHNVHPGMVISQDQAEAFLREDLEGSEKDVLHYVKVPLDQGQFDALVCLVFNIGGPKFSTSTLLRKLNAHDYLGAAAEFCKWNSPHNPKVTKGLTRRRAAERDLFLRG